MMGSKLKKDDTIRPAGMPGVNPFPSSFWGHIFALLARMLVWLRYRVRFQGFGEIGRRGKSKILFLPNHPAMIDPIILLSRLYPVFRPRSLADEWQMDRFLISFAGRCTGVRRLPNLERRGLEGIDETRRILRTTIEGLRQGENLLLYPSGHLKHQREEVIGAASAVKTILSEVPDVRIVMIRQNGLWGSQFSFGYTGRRPQLGKVLRHAVRSLLCGGLFFMPRREVVLEFVEPADFPRNAEVLTMNRWMENFYNEKAQPNTYTPYLLWERGGSRIVPEPVESRKDARLGSIPEGVRHEVLQKLSQQSGHPSPAPEHRLAQDLAMDSLAIAELVLWIEKEYGHSLDTPESLKTVADVILAAAGRGSSAIEIDIRPPSARWLQQAKDSSALEIPKGKTITEAFLYQANARPDRIIAADQISGEITYRRALIAVLLFKPYLEKISGSYLGILLPASAGATLLYISTLFSGKVPVMLNWTAGARHLRHSLDLLQVNKVITSRKLVQKLAANGIDLQELNPYFLFVEDLRGKITTGQKIQAALQGYLGAKSLYACKPPETAVVLFTSGSESLPKAVPLTHENLLSNLFTVLSQVILLRKGEIFLGMLPPFHSFGLMANILTCLCMGIPTVFHSNPTEATVLASLIEIWKASLMVGTPAFLNGIVRSAQKGQLASLRWAVVGAEKCPEAVYEALRQHCPHAAILEGYGITECSPIISANTSLRQIPGSIGWPIPSLEYLIVHPETLQPVPSGTIGILLVRGPSIFSGYLNYGGESPFVHLQGKQWYRTGDLVHQEPSGALFFAGRLKRFVKIGGEMISLPAIESELVRHYPPDESHGPLVAVESLGKGEEVEITLFAVPEIDRAEANRLLQQAGFSPLHNIRRVIRVETIPLLGTGKTNYRQLKELYSP